MEIFGHYYANFFTIGALIPTTFHLFLAYIFLTIKRKSSPTFHLGIAFLYLAVFNFGYFIAGGFYHPDAAFHRWITVGFILLHESHINVFMLNINRDTKSAGTKIFLPAQYAVSFIIAAIFFISTLNSGKTFIISAHHWDFDADSLSKIIGLLIIAYLCVFIGITARKVYTIKTRERYFILFMGLAYLFASLVPSMANLLSRDGIIDRGTFQVLWDLFSLAGLYLFIILYLNYTQDRVPIMSKIVSIIILTILLILQGFSFYSFKDNEKAFDVIHQSYAELALIEGNDKRGAAYTACFSADKGTVENKFFNNNDLSKLNFAGFRSEYMNSLMYMKIKNIDGDNFSSDLQELLTSVHFCFEGYKNALIEFSRSFKDRQRGLKEYTLSYLNEIKAGLPYHAGKIRAIPEAGFRQSLIEYLAKTDTGFRPFKAAIDAYLVKESAEGSTLKAGTLSLLAPLGVHYERHYRSHSNNHYISFFQTDEKTGKVYEVGFPYELYRAYLHPSAQKFINALFVIFFVTIVGFNFFFRGVLIIPLNRLVEGFRGISDGKLDVRIPEKLGDELGFASASFNKMADIISRAKEKLDEYTVNLEQSVEERTRDLSASEERYRNILASIQDGYYETDLTGKVVFINESMTRIMGFEKNEILNHNYSIFTDKKNAEMIFNIFNQVYKSGRPSGAFDYHVVQKDGSERITEAVASLITDYLGNKTGFRGMLRDITERKAAEEALRQSEEKYRSILNAGKIGYYEVNLQGDFTYGSSSFLDYTGYTEDELTSRNFKENVIKEDVKFVLNEFGQVYLGKTSLGNILIRARWKNEEISYGDNYITVRKDSSGQIIGFSCVVIDVTERNKAEDALRDSEEKYRSFVESASDGIFRNDLAGNFLYINPTGLKMLGCTEEELLKINYRDLVLDEAKDAVFDNYRRQVAEKLDETYIEFPVKRKDGEVRWFGQKTRLVSVSENKYEFHGISRDVTELKKAEEALRNSEEKYRTILDVGVIGYYESDAKGNFTFCNKSLQYWTGYTPEEITGMNFRQIVFEDDFPALAEKFINLFQGRSSVEIINMRIRKKDGSVGYGENYASVIKNSAGKITGFRGVGVDSTERKKAEIALQENEERFRNIMYNISDVIFICSFEGKILYINPLGAEQLGYTVDEICRLSFLHIISPEYRERELQLYIKQYNENIPETYHEYPALTKDGQIKWASQKVRMVQNSDGEYVFYGAARDITEMKKAEDARRELEEQKTRFFSNISHEIRTPLTLMLSPIESVIQGDYGNRINRSFFENLYRNGLRLFKLVNNLLDFSKIEAGRMKMRVQEIDLAAFVRNYVSAVHSAAESRGLNINFISEPAQVAVYLDPDKMDKVVMNLFSNSLKFTPNGGSISIHVTEDDDRVYIIFSDTGEGIPADSIESIFDRFSQADTSATRKHEGTGIGLALTKELVEMHGGTISVESRYIEECPEDHGAVFTVTLMKGRDHFEEMNYVQFAAGEEVMDSVSDHRFYGMREMHDLKQADETNPRSSDSSNIKSAVTEKSAGTISLPQSTENPESTVLIVDDNSDMRDFLSYLLKKLYTVNLAVNGQQGLELAGSLMPDLIITDVMMPVMDGHEMTRLLKDDPVLRHIPVIMLTAKAEMANKLEGLEHGADDFLTKPFNSKELMARVKTLLKTREYERVISRRNNEIEDEMEVARQLQQRLLPERISELSGYEKHAVYIPMDKVGGDFYDYTLRGQYVDLFIADVSGHGLPGAFLAMMTKISLESVTERQHTNRILHQVNEVICRSTVNSNYVTSFLCRIDTNTNIMKYSNAGHLPPLVYRRETGEFIELKTKGMPLGWFKNLKIDEKEIQLISGDRLIMYTDGITESINPQKEMFGDELFQEFIRDNRSLSPSSFCDSLLVRLRDYSQNDKFDDDLTIVVFDVL